MAEIDKVQVGGTSYDITNTKNTAGTTNKTGTKMFIAAATEQSANPQTYSNSNVYIGTDNCLYSGGTKVLTSHQDISGKVSGPSSATNNAVAIFDGTGGKTIKNSGFTIGKSVPSDAVFTDTWRPVQDNLTSTSTTDCLSANQGKVLNDKVGNRVNLGQISDVNIASRIANTEYRFTFPSNASNIPTAIGGGVGYLYTNGNSSLYGTEILYTAIGVYSRNLNNGTYGAWSAIALFDVNTDIISLNSNVANVETATIMTGVNSLSVLKTSLQTIADGLAVDKHKLVRFYSNFTSNGFFANLRYKGYLMVYQKSGSTATDYSILFEGELGHNVLVNCHDNTWYIEELALNSNVTALRESILHNILSSAVTIPSTGIVEASLTENRTNYTALLLEFGQPTAQRRCMAFVTGARNNNYVILSYGGTTNITIQDVYVASGNTMKLKVSAGTIGDDLTLYNVYGLGKIAW